MSNQEVKAKDKVFPNALYDRKDWLGITESKQCSFCSPFVLITLIFVRPGTPQFTRRLLPAEIIISALEYLLLHRKYRIT